MSDRLSKETAINLITTVCQDIERQLLVTILPLCADGQDTAPPNEEAEAIRRMLEAIKAKDHISAKEGALLLGCSDGHLHDLVKKVKKGEAEYPIPFIDLDGVVQFPVSDLIAWSRIPKPRPATKPAKKGGRKDKTHLEAVAS